MTLLDQMRNRIQRLNGAEKLILLNVLCFILPLFFNTVLFLFNIQTDFYVGWFELSASLSELLFKPWTLVSYSFMHSGFFHLFWNMYLLFFASRLFLNLFTPKTFFNLYFLGVIVGGLTFMLSYALFPAFQNSNPIMIGASAGVMAVFIFMSTYSPDLEVRLILFNLKLRYLGIAFVLLDVVQIPYGNAGGHIAHLGGSALGFFYAGRLSQGVDIGEPFGNKIDSIINMFKKKPKMKTVYKKQKHSHAGTSFNKKDDFQKRIDEILDKISVSGYESLSQEEKDFLFRAGKK
jgi:membrane associated rhomboid family serine protease